MPCRGDLEGSGRRRRQPQTRQDRHLPGEGPGLRRLLPQAAMHHQQEWPVPEARSRGRIHRAGQGVHGDGAVPQSHTQAQGVDRAAVRGGEALAPDAPVPDEDFREDQHRGAADRRRAEREAAAYLRTDKSEGSSAGSSAQVVRKAAFKSDPGPSHGSSARFSTDWSVYGTTEHDFGVLSCPDATRRPVARPRHCRRSNINPSHNDGRSLRHRPRRHPKQRTPLQRATPPGSPLSRSRLRRGVVPPSPRRRSRPASCP